MKKIVLATIAITLLALESNAQNMEWAKTFGNTGDDFAHSVTADINGNVYSAGRFLATVDFDPSAGTTNLTSNGGSDMFIQKLDPNGNLLWAKSFGSTQDDFVYSITTDATGNVYTTGYFWGTTDFDPNAGITNLTVAGGCDVFIQKLDPNGNLLWAKGFGGSAWDFGQSVSIDANGNVITTGYFSGTADFDPGAGILNYSSNGSSDVFVQKLDSNGDLLWAKVFGGGNDERGEVTRADLNGNVYTTGFFIGSVDFDPGAGTSVLNSNGAHDVYIQKLDPNGNFLWAKSFGGTGVDIAYGLEINQTGDIYTTGFFLSTVDFDPGAGTLNYTSNGSSDIFVQKLDQNGNMLWTKVMGGGVDDEGRSLSLDLAGNVYTTGRFQSTVDFDPNAGTSNLITNGSTDVYIQKLDSNGDLVWARNFGGTDFDFGRSISVDINDNIYALGDFAGTADFDPNVGTFNVTSNGLNDIFLEKITQCVPTLNPVVPSNGSSTVNCITDAVQSASPNVTDECGTTIVPVINVGANPACLGDKIYTYTYTDYIGNSSVYTYTYTIDDNINPTGSNPVAINVECASDIPAQDVLVVTDEVDNCSIPVVAFVSDLSDGGSCPETITRTYSITDACGNSITVEQTITVSDVTLPTASVPGGIVVELISDVPVPDPLVILNEADNCTVTPIVGWVGDVSDGSSCPETITRTYSVTDDCGNQITVTQTIVVSDVTSPTASNPNTVNVECSSDVPAPDPIVVTDEADNGNTPIVVWVSDVSNGGVCPEIITRTFSITDDCGNQILVDQTINILDVTPPTASNPATENVECSGDIPAQDILIITDEADNCSSPTVAFVSDVSDGLSNPETITRTYSITDNCGNSINVIQLIVVQDITAPLLDGPCVPGITAVCEVASLTPPTATDNCSGVVTISNDATYPITAATTIIWTLEDAAGNTITHSQMVTITTVDATIVMVNNGIVATNSDADSYQWVDCDDNHSPIAGEIGQSFAPTVNGNYAVEVTVGNCTETSVCESINTIGIDENNLTSLKLFPNPSFSILTIETEQTLEKVAIYDLTGVLVDVHYASSFSVEYLATGTYTAVIFTSKGTVRKRFVKQ